MANTGDIEGMTGKSASLLTQTQRNRIQGDFSDLSDEEKHRDQQRIRERIRSGVLDFTLLADYPDRQFVLAFDTVPDDELRAALADTVIVVERLRELHGYDRADLIEETRIRAEKFSETTVEANSLEQIELQTAAEVRQRTEAAVEEQFRAGRWDTRASRLAKLGASAFIPVALFELFGLFIRDIPKTSPLKPLLAFLTILVAVSLLGWVLIMAAKALKYDILPALAKLVRDPQAVLRGMFEKVIKNPGKTVRESWNEL